MERRAKERLIGALVLVMLAVIVIPLILDDSIPQETTITESNIPPGPDFEFASKIVPLPPPPPAGQPADKHVATAPTAPTLAQPEPAATTAGPAPATAGGGENAVEPVRGRQQDRGDGIAVGMTAWVVQLGSFASEENAASLNEKLRKAGYASFMEPLQQDDGGSSFRVRVGPELRRSDAQSLRDRIQKSVGVDGIVVAYP